MIPDELKRMKPMTGKERLGAHRDSEYLGAEDIDPDVEPVLTIQDLYYGMITLQRGKEAKDVISFVEERVNGINQVRPLVVNSTNRGILKKLYKKVDAETLKGKQVQLYVDHNVKLKGDTVDGIRIKLKIPKPEQAAAEITHVCEECGNPLRPAYGMGVTKLAEYTKQKYGRKLCADCAAKEKDKQNTAEQSDAAETETEE